MIPKLGKNTISVVLSNLVFLVTCEKIFRLIECINTGVINYIVVFFLRVLNEAKHLVLCLKNKREGL